MLIFIESHAHSTMSRHWAWTAAAPAGPTAHPSMHAGLSSGRPPALEQFPKGRDRRSVCRAKRHACLFDRAERTRGARGGGRSAHASSRSPRYRRGDHGQTRRGPTARDRLAYAHAPSGTPAPAARRRAAGGAAAGAAGAAGGSTGCHAAGAWRLVGGTAGPAAEPDDEVAGAAPAGLDAEKKTRAASERDEHARAAWREAVAQRAPEPFVFVD